MPQTTSWIQLERLTYNQLALLEGNDNAAVNGQYTVATATASSYLEAAFPITAVRQQIIHSVMDAVGNICRNPKDPARSLYRKEVTLANGDALPYSMGKRGAVTYTDGSGVKHTMIRRDLATVAQIIEDSAPGKRYADCPQYFYALDGDSITTTQTPVKMAVYDYQIQYWTGVLTLDYGGGFTEIDAVFNSSNFVKVKLPDELADAVVAHTCGFLSAKIANYEADSARWMAMYTNTWAGRGLQVEAAGK